MPASDVIEMYEPRFLSTRHRTFYGDSGYSNFGYWTDGTATGREACDQLLDRLLGMLPAPPAAVLDVACGEGGTTARVHERFPAAAITAVNISPGQLARAAARCPAARFMRMDATRLEFAAASFDLVLCVEAAYHFNTRERFLREAFRVLRPGGTLLLTDGIVRGPLGPLARRIVPDLASMPAENFVDRAGYERLLADTGFNAVVIEEAIAKTFLPCSRRFLRHAWLEYLQPGRWPAVLREAPPPLVALWWTTSRRHLEEYLLVRAVRPQEQRP
jgi:MPBQ/MSBQ methyltransferase